MTKRIKKGGTVDYHKLYTLSEKYKVLRAPRTLLKLTAPAIAVVGALGLTAMTIFGIAPLFLNTLSLMVIGGSIFLTARGVYKVAPEHCLVRTVLDEPRYEVYVVGTGLHWPWEGGREEQLGPRVVDKVEIPYLIEDGLIVIFDSTPKIRVYDPIAYQEGGEEDAMLHLKVLLAQYTQDALAAEGTSVFNKKTSAIAEKILSLLKGAMATESWVEGHGNIPGIIIKEFGMTLVGLEGSTITPPVEYAKNMALLSAAKKLVAASQKGGGEPMSLQKAIQNLILFGKGDFTKIDFGESSKDLGELTKLGALIGGK